MIDQPTLRGNLKRLIVQSLNLDGLKPDTIGDDTPLFGQGLGLDSVDALELVVAIEKEYGVSIQSHEVDKTAFACVASLGEFVARILAGANTASTPDGR